MYIKIWQELEKNKSMVFLAGPRQSGKTTLSKIIAKSFVNSLYFNWDISDHRALLMENPHFFESIERKDSSTPLIIFDEIHKYKDWKNYLKGIYDRFHEEYRFLISGSGRLDIYQKGGDSLAGRYFLFHLWPFTIAELAERNAGMEDFLKNPLHISMERSNELEELWEKLSSLSGFPEPYISGKETTYRRWSNTYSNQLIREDIRDMVDIKSVQEMETLYMMLPSRVGSPLSIPSLMNDLKVSYNSIRNWLVVLERFFLIFSIPTWTGKIARAIQKERKVYLWDSPRIKDPAARFENMAAVELWRAVTLWNDMGHGTFSLHFIKNKEKQEVDFLIANNNDPFLLIEAKLSDTQPSQALLAFQQRLDIPAVQLTGRGAGYRLISNDKNKILVAPAYQWLSQLP
ncbi:MAG: ATP-binding protein [Thermodesulfovibrionales bacterium]|nr:ATP-binding protein [Thermodesulfovibrionales bacterium]